jgi:CRISPR-associated protein Csb2
VTFLALEIDLLLGQYRAAELDRVTAEWPPHPERIFSALVQAWGDGGRADDERRALEWLERLDPPEIEASSIEHAAERTSPTVYVPPNDQRGDEVAALPDRRPRQARTFAVRVPASPAVRIWWRAEPPQDLLPPLQALARRVSSIGHSASFTRCAFRTASDGPGPERAWRPGDDGHGHRPLRQAYPGRLADLERWFSTEGGKRRQRPLSRKSASYASPEAQLPQRVESVFGDRKNWFVFMSEDTSKFVPDVVAFAHVARRVRDVLMPLAPQPPLEVISGHGPDGGPSTRPHLAVVPMMNVGWPQHSDGRLLGFAIVLPRTLPATERQVVIGAIGQMARQLKAGQKGLHLSRDRTWFLRPASDAPRASLSPDRWCGLSSVWATATPLVLDRFPDPDDPAEEARLIAAACVNIGLREPVEIQIHKHSALSGATSAYPARGRSHHADWTFPGRSKLAQRPRRHVVLRFPEVVRGPVILGAGRYHGLGLCLPLDSGQAE